MEDSRLNRLRAFEQMYAELVSEHQSAVEELNRLRAAGKEKTVRFRELLGQKMVLSQQIARFERYGL